MKNIKYGFGKVTSYSFDDAIQRVTEELQKEGFSVLTNINLSATLKNKLDKEIPPYQILGACNPYFAYDVIEKEPSIGMLLPCSIVIRQDNTGKVYIEFMDPKTVLEIVDNPEILHIAAQVRQGLERVLNAV